MAKDYSSDLLDLDKPHKRCADTHPPLKVGAFLIYGGSASHPVVRDADLYVSLQGGSTSGLISDPWDEKHVTEIQFSIIDGHAPRAAELLRFQKMVEYICNQLQIGKKVHVGCIGGHGRTGLVLSAVAAALGEKDAIRYVRKNYCKKAVETNVQVKFLVKHYDVLTASASRPDYGFKGTPKGSSKGSSTGWSAAGDLGWSDTPDGTEFDDGFNERMKKKYPSIWDEPLADYSRQSPAKQAEKAAEKANKSMSKSASAQNDVVIDGLKANRTVLPLAGSPRNLWKKPKGKKNIDK